MAIRNAQTVARLHPVGRPFWAMATVLFIFLITIIIILTDSIVHPSSSLSVYRSLGQFARRWGPARHTKCSEPRCSPPPAQARPAPQLLYQALTASRADETRPTHPDRQVRCSLREILYKNPHLEAPTKCRTSLHKKLCRSFIICRCFSSIFCFLLWALGVNRRFWWMRSGWNDGVLVSPVGG